MRTTFFAKGVPQGVLLAYFLCLQCLMTRRPLWSISVQSFMLYNLQQLEQIAYLVKLSRSKQANFRRRYNEEGMIPSNSWRYWQPDKSRSTLMNWKRNCKSHSRPLSLNLHNDCHTEMKYTSHWTSDVNFWVLVCFGEGSGQLSLLLTSARKSSSKTSSQISGSCSSPLLLSVSESLSSWWTLSWNAN